jgi:hypothetical protein
MSTAIAATAVTTAAAAIVALAAAVVPAVAGRAILVGAVPVVGVARVR